MLDPIIFKYLGYAAATLTTVSFLPQAVMTIKTKDTNSISLSMYILFFSGVMLWVLYGLSIQDKPLIFANIITATFAFIILYMKLQNTFRSRTK